jgi:tetratricopeptide (TPR) repeat protein
MTAAVYLCGGIYRAKFVYFDDGKYVYFNGGGGYVEQNRHVCAGLTRDSARWAFTSMEEANWHPLTWLSHMLDVTLFGLWAGGHHLTSLALHCANAVLVFLVLRSLSAPCSAAVPTAGAGETPAPQAGCGQSRSGAVWPSAAVAALFALHPLHVESVAWVAERKDVLSTFLGLLTLLAYASYARHAMAEKGDSPHLCEAPSGPFRQMGTVPFFRPSRRYLLVIVGLALGLMAKPMLVTLPFVCLLLDYWPLGRLGPSGATAAGPNPPSQKDRSDPSSRGAPSKKSRRRSARAPAAPRRPAAGSAAPPPARTLRQRAFRLVAEKAPLLALAAASCVVTYIAQQGSAAIVHLEALSLAERLENVLTAYVRYLGKTLWPAGLASLYPLRGENLHALTALAAAALLVAVSAAVVLAARHGRRYLAVGWFWYLGTLVPVIGLVQVGEQSMADRYTYLPSLGLFIMAAWGAADVTARWRHRRLALVLLAQAVLLPCMILTARQAAFWADSETLFRHTLSVTTNNRIAHNNLGNILTWRGAELHDMARTEAIEQYRRAVEIDSRYAEAYNNLGNTLQECNRLGEAVRQYRKAIGAKADYPEAHNNLGNALLRLGQVPEAIEHYEAAIRLKPAYPEAHFGLGNAWYKMGQVPEAIEHYEAAVRLRPDYLQARNNLVLVLNRLAAIRAAAPEAAQRDGAQAVRLAQRACQLAGGQNPELLDTLAAAYAEAGSFDQAVATAREAIRLASAAGRGDLAAQIGSRLALYEVHRPCRTAKP